MNFFMEKSLLNGEDTMYPSYFYIIGKFFELAYYIKSPLGRIALRRKGIMLLTQPALGGEFHFVEFFVLKS